MPEVDVRLRVRGCSQRPVCLLSKGRVEGRVSAGGRWLALSDGSSGSVKGRVI